MVQADLEGRYLDMVPSVYYLMLDGCDLKTMARSKKYLSVESIKKILLSWELEHLALTDIRLLEIYKIPNEADMEAALKEYVEYYKKYFFKYPDNYMKGFFYVNNKWVKKNQKGEAVERLERPTVQEITELHINDKWFMNLKMKYEGILYSHDKELMFEQDLMEESLLETSKGGELDPLDMVDQVCQLMLDCYNLKTIVKKTGFSKKSIEKILVSRELEHVINSAMSLAEIYKIPNEADMESGLKEYTKKYESPQQSGFNDPQYHTKGFSYVGQCWVKKDRAGKIVKRIKRLKVKDLPHANEKWFLDLTRKYNDIWSFQTQAHKCIITMPFDASINMKLEKIAIDATLDSGNNMGLKYW